MSDDIFESQTAFDEANAAEWRDMLLREWSRQFVSLTSATYYLASSGAPVEPTDGALERAAAEIVRRLQDGNLQAYGKRAYYDALQAISLDEISSATLDGSTFLDSPPLDAALHLSWAIIPGGDDDRIESRSAVRWGAVSIRRPDLAGLLSLVIVEPAQRCGRSSKKIDRIVVEMIDDNDSGIAVMDMSEAEMAHRYRASDKTCRAARRIALEQRK